MTEGGRMMKHEICRRELLQAGLITNLCVSDNSFASSLTGSPDLTSLSLENASQALRKRSLSPVELTKACLERIERLNPTLNAFSVVMADQALAQARTAEKEIHTGKWRGPL